MKTGYLFALLILLGSLNAFPSGYTQPACDTDYGLFGFNFSYSTAGIGQNITCSDSLAVGYGTFSDSANAEIHSYSLANSSHILITRYKGAQTAGVVTLDNIAMPTTGNYTFSITQGCAAEQATLYCYETATNIIDLTGAGVNGTIREHNSTHYNITGGAQTGFCSKNSTVKLTAASSGACGDAKTFFYPIYNAYFQEPANTANLTLYGFGIYIGGYGKIVRSDILSNRGSFANPGQYCKAILYFGTNILTPKITYIPGVDAYGDFYNTTNNAAFVKNNTVQYIYDSVTGQWYLAPAFECTNFNDVYTVSTLFYDDPGSVTNTPLPLVPLSLSCKQNGSLYQINSLYGTSVVHVVTFSNNSTVNITTSTGNSFAYIVNTTTYPNVNYTVDGTTACQRATGSSLLGLTSLPITMEGVKPLLILMWLGAIAISVAVPFGIVLPIMLNDLFSLISTSDMALVVVFLIPISMMVRGTNKDTLKASVVYALFGIMLLGPIMVRIDFSSPLNGSGEPQFPAISALKNNELLNNTSNIFGNPNTAPDLGAFVVGAPRFIQAIFELIITIPGALSEAISAPLLAVSPEIYSASRTLLTVLNMAALIYIFIKAYEVLSNRFQRI